MPTNAVDPTAEPHTIIVGFHPAAVAPEPTVEAVRNSLADLADRELLAVPIGNPLDNFDIVEWCANNRKHVINRFDPWPLEYLLIENTPAP